MSVSENTGRYLSAFKEWQSTAKEADPSWIKELRQSGIASFASLGFPTTKNEEWRYTNVEPVVSQPFGLANGEMRSLDAADVLSNAFVEVGAP
ncbi:MAG TPA: hypothetical protein VKH62_13740, partial [Candidatus Binatia bacterium]|nr:hypothetical protein [Candidatus Binatia bacterium]